MKNKFFKLISDLWCVLTTNIQAEHAQVVDDSQKLIIESTAFLDDACGSLVRGVRAVRGIVDGFNDWIIEIEEIGLLGSHASQTQIVSSTATIKTQFDLWLKTSNDISNSADRSLLQIEKAKKHTKLPTLGFDSSLLKLKRVKSIVQSEIDGLKEKITHFEKLHNLTILERDNVNTTST